LNVFVHKGLWKTCGKPVESVGITLAKDKNCKNSEKSELAEFFGKGMRGQGERQKAKGKRMKAKGCSLLPAG